MLTSWRKKSYYDISEFGKNHRQYRNESEKTIFWEWDSAGNELIAGQVATNVCLLKSLALQYKSHAGLEKAKMMLNWALVLQVSKVTTKHKRSKNTLSYSDILSVKNSDGISTPLPNNLIARYRSHLDQDGLAKPGVPLIQECIEDEEITMEGREFVV